MSLNRIREKVKIVSRFIGFWRNAKSIDSVDSPLLFKLCSIIKDRHHSITGLIEIEKRRTELLRNHSTIHRESLGAQSTIHRSDSIKVSAIAKSSVSSKLKCQLLYDLITFINPKSVLELGTSLAISTGYISMLENVDTIDSVEGSSSIHSINTQAKHSSKVNLVHSDFQSFIELQRQNNVKYDCILLDGHHEEAPTITYVNQFLEMLNPQGFIIIDDIYWSQGMMNAWNILKEQSPYNLNIDLFYYGILSKQESVKEPIEVKLWPYARRWQLGLFR